MKPKVCLETTIPSYLTSRLSRDLLVAADQQIMSDWWHDHRHRFSLFVSPRVQAEAGSGDSAAAARPLMELKRIPILALTTEARLPVTHFPRNGLIPQRSVQDASHVAIADLVHQIIRNIIIENRVRLPEGFIFATPVISLASLQPDRLTLVWNQPRHNRPG